MIARQELLEWLRSPECEYIAVDDGGLTLVALDHDGKETGPYLEVGGIPEAQS